MIYKQIKHIRECCPILATVSDDELMERLGSAVFSDIAEGEAAIEAGHMVDYACILINGRLATLFKRDWGEDRIIEYIDVGNMLSVAELLSDNECQNEVRALQNSQLLCIPRQDYLQLITQHEDIVQTLSEQARAKSLRLLVIKYLSDIFGVAQLKMSDPLLRIKAEEEWLDFENELLSKIDETTESIKLKRGEYLFHQNDESHSAYILASGLLRVTVNLDDGEEHEINRVNHGEMVGEIGLITDKNRSANVIAMRDCELLRMPAQSFSHIAEKYPRVTLNIYRTISERINRRFTHDSDRHKQSNFAILTLSDSEVINTLVDDFHQALQKIDNTELLTSDTVDQQLARTGIANISSDNPGNMGLMQWLNGKENKRRYIIYRADKNWSEWNRRCISQAEKILIFVEAKDQSRFDELKSQLNSIPGLSWNLLLIHDQSTERPEGSAKWLAESAASEIYHVRHRHTDDIERLARILSGNAISLVLGGGGARGFAHLGALRALHELDIKIDMVGGTSIGAPIAAWVAQGRSVGECCVLAQQAFSSLIDWTVPLVSMINGSRISKSIMHQTGDWDIEDYWLPYFCVSTDLTTASQLIHRRGHSAEAIRASVSIPGVLPPVPHKGHLLVDGGIMNNIPINIMRDINPSGTVIAFDVSPTSGPIAEEDYGMSLSGWHQLFKKIAPWRKPVKAPNIAEVIMESMVVGSNSLRKKMLLNKLADYYQNIPVTNVGILDFNALDRAEKIGYENVIESLRHWRDNRNKIIE